MSKRTRAAKSAAPSAGDVKADAIIASVPDVSPTEVAARMTPPTDEDRARIRAEQDQLFAARNIQRPDAPAEPDTTSYTPALGDNPDGLTDQTRIAHAATDEERAAIIADIESKRRA